MHGITTNVCYRLMNHVIFIHEIIAQNWLCTGVALDIPKGDQKWHAKHAVQLRSSLNILPLHS